MPPHPPLPDSEDCQNNLLKSVNQITVHCFGLLRKEVRETAESQHSRNVHRLLLFFVVDCRPNEEPQLLKCHQPTAIDCELFYAKLIESAQFHTRQAEAINLNTKGIVTQSHSLTGNHHHHYPSTSGHRQRLSWLWNSSYSSSSGL